MVTDILLAPGTRRLWSASGGSTPPVPGQRAATTGSSSLHALFTETSVLDMGSLRL
jgi:hypothetical protein